MIKTLKILFHQGKQYIPDVRKAQVPGLFRGRPVISEAEVDTQALIGLCPTGALYAEGSAAACDAKAGEETNSAGAGENHGSQTGSARLCLDLGRCVFCGECQRCFPEKIHFTQDYKIASSTREGLVVHQGEDKPFEMDLSGRAPEVRRLFRRSLKLRQVSAAGDNSAEWELGAVSNVNFDMGRFGIEFVASPRHADGLVVTGPVSKNMARALKIAYEALPMPRLLILAGTDAISGGIYADSPELDRSFLESQKVDLYLPGNPPHPLTIINGLLDYTRRK